MLEGLSYSAVRRQLAEEVFVRLNGLLRDDEGKTKKKLKELEPPLTWGEVLGYVYYNLQEKEGWGDNAGAWFLYLCFPNKTLWVRIPSSAPTRIQIVAVLFS